MPDLTYHTTDSLTDVQRESWYRTREDVAIAKGARYTRRSNTEREGTTIHLLECWRVEPSPLPAADFSVVK